MNNTITLPAAELRTALAGFSKFMPRFSRLPVLDHLRLARDTQGRVTLEGTNLNSHALFRLDKPQEGPPTVMLAPCAGLASMSRNLDKNDFLSLSAISDCAVKIGSKLGVNLIEEQFETPPLEDFPQTPNLEGRGIAITHLRESILQAFKCAFPDESRQVLHGVYLDVSMDGHCVVATDGRHLYSANSFRLDMRDSIILPIQKFLEWSGFVQDGDWKLVVAKNTKDPHLRIDSHHWSYLTKRVEGVFPNWRQVVPSANSTQTQLSLSDASADLLAAALQRLPGASDPDHPVRLFMTREGFKVKAHAKGQPGSAQAEIPGVKIQGRPMAVNLNRQYLLKALSFGFRQIEFGHGNLPLRFSMAGRQMIVMPLNDDPPVPPATSASSDAPKQKSPTPSPQPEPTNPEPNKPMKNDHSSASNVSAAPDSPSATTGRAEEATAIKTAISQVEAIREALKETASHLGELINILKNAAKEQRTTEKEVESVRETLKNLQKVKI
ncbi:MAG: hypothetical protein PHV34_08955 [Verrucomicrobiae bacterium]|nr:hypothetical protein [Verrucomicrobiae bacterium]